MNQDIYEKLADALESLAKKYSIPVEELQPIAKMCGAAIAQSHMDGLKKPQEGDFGGKPSQPMPEGEDGLEGALAGR